MSKPTFVEVIIPLAVPNTYTYAVPFEWAERVQVGQSVIVQFGKKRFYSAIVAGIHHNKPTDYQAKLIDEIVEETPIVTLKQLEFWKWMANYYMSTIGEVMTAALPNAFKLSSESTFVYIENEDFDWKQLTDEEFLLVEALQANHELNIGDIQIILEKKTVYPIIEKLMYYRLCIVKEEINEKYKEKQISYIDINPQYKDELGLQQLFEQLSKSDKQTEVLLAYLRQSPQRNPIPKNELTKLENISQSSLNTLIKNNIFVEQKQTVSRIIQAHIDVKNLDALNPYQQEALQKIKTNFEDKTVCVLEGVTGSGKTHIYVKLIEEQVKQGKQVLYLLPEIALTAQIVLRLQKYFGNKIAVYHSKFNDNERVEIYKSVLQNKTPIVLAARSGVFLPFSNVGLIIVDEEHERSYKQFDPAPRYHARDAAIVLAYQFKAKVLLGSATLSLETYHNVYLGKYNLVQLKERHGNAILPQIELIDTLELSKRKKMHGLFSEQFLEAIKTALENKEQVILFQNRRGFANYVNCNVCNWIPYCPNCDVSLTYHKFFNKLVCHYCGHQHKMYENCKACGSHDVQVKGFGTEQIEDEIQILFPQAKIARLDLDSTRRKHAHEEIIFEFQNREIDILIGTQMVTKGLDFEHVSVVGIVAADQLFSFPDFRAGERAFQLLAQVGGRAGRKAKQGKVLIQTKNPQHPILQHIKNYTFESVYFEEMLTRKQFNYPPFSSLLQIDVKHKQADKAQKAATFLAQEIRRHLGKIVLGPSNPLIGKVRNYYIKQILIKAPKNSQQLTEIKQHIQKSVENTLKQFKTAVVNIEVDA